MIEVIAAGSFAKKFQAAAHWSRILPAADGIVVQIHELRNLLAGFAVIKQKNGICATRNTVRALATHASLELDAVC